MNPLLVALAFAWFAAPVHAQYKFTKIAEHQRGSNVEPWGFGGHAVNSSGAVAYIEHTPASSALRVYQDGATTTLAEATGDIRGLGGQVDINDDGTVVFHRRLDSGERGIFMAKGGSTIPLATTSTPSPWGENFTGFGESLSINSAGTVAFLGRSGDRSGIFTYDGAVSTITDESGPLHDFGSRLGLGMDALINDDGTVAFAAAFDDSPDTMGVFTSAGGAYSTIAEAPGAFLTVESLNDSGDLLYRVLSQGRQWPGGDEMVIADGETTRVVVDSILLRHFGPHASMNNAGEVVYDLKADLRQHLGVRILVGPDAETLIAGGDPLFGSTIRAQGQPSSEFFKLSSRSLNDRGQIAFRYELANRRVGIALATPVPEPIGVLLSLGAILLLPRKRR
jgi:hypothetical protein